MSLVKYALDKTTLSQNQNIFISFLVITKNLHLMICINQHTYLHFPGLVLVSACLWLDKDRSLQVSYWSWALFIILLNQAGTHRILTSFGVNNVLGNGKNISIGLIYISMLDEVLCNVLRVTIPWFFFEFLTRNMSHSRSLIFYLPFSWRLSEYPSWCIR